MPEQAKLSIVNYGFNIRSKVDPELQKEDDQLISIARNIIKKHNFGKGAVMITEAYHTDLANGNHYIYTSENMDKLIKSFYDPFMTPFLCFHDDMSKPIGTNIHAKYFRKPVQINRGIASGYGKLATFIPETSTFGDELVIDLIQQRRFMAVSIGSKSRRDQMLCTVCNQSIFDCDHRPGKDYDGVVCSIKIQNPIFTECSMAGGNPADINAMTRRMDCFDTEDIKSIESIVDIISDPWSVAIYDNAIISQFPGVDIPGTTKLTDGEGSMNEQTVAEIIKSYEARIDVVNKDNEALASALVNANNTITKLQAKGTEETLTDQDTEIESEQTSAESEEPAVESEPIDETASDTTQDEVPATDAEVPADDTVSTTDVESETQTVPEETQENTSTESGTETQVIDTTKEKPEDLLRGIRNAKMLGIKTGILSHSYRV